MTADHPLAAAIDRALTETIGFLPVVRDRILAEIEAEFGPFEVKRHAVVVGESSLLRVSRYETRLTATKWEET